MENLEGRIPRDIKKISLSHPIVDYKKEYEDDSVINEAKGEIEKFNFVEGQKESIPIGNKAIGIIFGENGTEYNASWVHLGRDYFKLISKVESTRTC
jgi:hypothetical protein